MRRFVFALGLLALAASTACADDIVTMPTANQLKAGQIDVAGYQLFLEMPAAAPQAVRYQTVYLGLSDWLELDVHRADVDKDKTSMVLVGSVKLLSEGPSLLKPDLVVGVRNIGGTETTNHPLFREKTRERSLFLSAAKTFFIRSEPGPPLVRAHVSVGTADWTLMNEERHKGAFGGLQFLFHPMVGAVLQHDGQDLITGITLMPKNSGLTLKGGTFGDHTWVGLAFRRSL